MAIPTSAPAPAVFSQQRCLHHAGREAVARCPECRNFFCRECIVEHEGRVLCAVCLRRLTPAASAGRFRFAALGRIVLLAGSVFAAWLFFYLAGRALLNIPASFHEGLVWRSE